MMPLRMVLIEGADRFGFVSPWRNIKPVKQKKSDVDPFTLDEVNRFLDTGCHNRRRAQRLSRQLTRIGPTSWF
jgi:hypothetical protein